MASTGARLRPSTNQGREAEEGRASPAFRAQASQGEATIELKTPQPPPLTTVSDAFPNSVHEKITDAAFGATRTKPHPKHKERKKLLQDGLHALGTSDASALLLCWGPPDHCHGVSVLIKDGWKPVDEWKEARRVWDETKRSWKSWLPWYGIKGVRVVEITIVGRLSHTPDGFLGIHRQDALDEKAALLQSLKQDFWMEDFYCKYEVSRNSFDHDVQCSDCAADFQYYVCPYEEHQKNWADLRRLRRRRMLKMMFCNPELAELNEPMDDGGLRLLISHQKLLDHISAVYCPTIGDLSFPGIHIQEGWLLTSPWMMLSSVAGTTLGISVPLAWLIYRDWAVAWNVGACFLTLCIAVCTGVYRAAEQETW